MTRLIMRRGPTIGAIYELTQDMLTIGRGAKNDIIIRDNEVSREHCRLIRLVDDYEVEDLASSNGTFVDGQRVTRNWLLKPGALVELGDSITLEYMRMHERPTSPAIDSETQESVQVAHELVGRFALLMTQGPDIGRIFSLEAATLTIGRDLSNDIVVQDPEVSRTHARLRRTAHGYEIEDLGSTNGTTLNTLPLTDSTLLQEDDVVRLGTNVSLQFVAQTGALHDEETITWSAPDMTQNSVIETRHPLIAAGRESGRRRTTPLGTGLEPGALENHVLVAYDRADWETLIAPLTLHLQDAGVKVWVDQYLTQGGADWRVAMEQALFECWLMVVVLTPRALTLNSVRMSYTYFLNREKPLIPFVMDPALPMPVELGRRRAIVYNTDDGKRSLHKLVFEIMQVRNQMRQPP